MTQPSYYALVGLDYTPIGKAKPIRVEAGERAPGIPKRAQKWLLETNAITTTTPPDSPQPAAAESE